MPSNLSYDDAFAHGYLVTNSRLTGGLRSWRTFDLASFKVYLQEKTRYGLAQSADLDADFCLIGHPVDLDQSTVDADVIASTAMERYRAGGLDAVIRYVAYLGGRFTFIARAGGHLYALPDCHASQSVFWAKKAMAVSISSHAVLVAQTLGLEEDRESKSLLALLREIKSSGARFYPGVRTAARTVRPVFANCMLTVQISDTTTKHSRFYPFEDLETDGNPDRLYEQFSELFQKHLTLLNRFGPFTVSLTAGKDSLVTFLGLLDEGVSDFFAFTLHQYLKPQNTYKDMYAANSLAFKAGIQHRVLKWNVDIKSHRFDSMFHQTWMNGGQARPFARSLYEELPHHLFHYQSNAAETGTAFFTERSESEPTARRLTRLWQGRSVEDRTEFHQEFEEYIDYSDFRLDSLRNLDYHDAFYWEHRNTSWAANRYHEGDLGQRVLLPFNQRSLIETMLAMPLQQRIDNTLQRRFAEDRIHLVGENASALEKVF